MFKTRKPWLPQKSNVFEDDDFEGDNEKVSFYTGLPTFDILKKPQSFMSPRVTRSSLQLSKFQEFVLVLIKLHLSVPHQDLGYCLNVSRTVVYKNYCQLVDCIGCVIILINFPGQVSLQLLIMIMDFDLQTFVDTNAVILFCTIALCGGTSI